MAFTITTSSQGSTSTSGLQLARSWENAITGIGQIFKDATHFKKALRNYSIAHNKDYQFIENDKLKVTVKCINESYPWRLHASRVGQQGTFKIKTFSNTHSCGSGIGRDGHPKASKIWVADIVFQKVRDRPLYRPIDIKKDIQKDFGIHLSYRQAWLDKEVARVALHGEHYTSFDLLRWYGEAVAETNPENLFVLEYPDRYFERVFICFHACLVGFKSECCPLLFMDGTHILNRYGGVMLSAMALDVENEMFPLAFAIVSAENDVNWI
uniref:Uncharacterized protein LOC105060610 n=1 Tax=Elaeis guineensis var. tenera TaxID=51953 RepID=A0A6I9SFX8_ELAGV|nr:uncharacterized protein LOC105060610 [Elaeis guineensis]